MFTKEEFNTLESAIWSTWDYIACDAYELCEGKNAIAIELCVDAGRLADATHDKNTGLDAETILHNAIDKHGYSKVAAYLNRKVRLL